MRPKAEVPGPCRHRHRACCLWPEHRNPGLRPEFHCARLGRLMEDFDAFLDRAEAFGLSDAQAERLFRARREKPLFRSACPLQTCEETTTATAGAVAGCEFFLQGLCLKRLPPCATPCPYAGTAAIQE
jgi:hypothetical protein